MPRPPDDVLKAQRLARSEASDRVVQSSSSKRLIVAGPGAGKTYTFQKAFDQVGNKGLALTFIKALERSLRDALLPTIDVSTFHRYCMHLFRTFHGSEPFMYPSLFELVAGDLTLGGRQVTRDDIECAFYELDDSTGLLTAAIDRADYYGAVSYNDIVYRVLRSLQAEPKHIEQFPLIVVDEYQDFNRLETEFIAVLSTQNNVLIAGDDDQSLYRLRRASPAYLRSRARDRSFERFELPYCSRCTSVVVGAVKDVIARARAEGLLSDRIDKQFECYLPDKWKDSDDHPDLIVADCSTEAKTAPYMSRYVVQQIGLISAADIAQSHAEKYPTVLVIAPSPFLQSTYELIKSKYPHAELRMSEREEIDEIDGYRRVLVEERSRIGWRILAHCFPPVDLAAIIEKTKKGDELFDGLPAEYRSDHLSIAAILRRVIESGAVTDGEKRLLEDRLSRSLDDIRAKVVPQPEATPPAVTADQPSIVCTTLVGAKGLSASYVFIVGLMNDHLPRNRAAVTDDDVWRLVVALSRTRKECHLIFCRRYAGTPKTPSILLGWIQQSATRHKVNKSYWNASPGS
jgi:superfamily I DNA/RNA helicase